MDCYADEIVKIQKEFEENPLKMGQGKAETVRYDWEGGYGYQIKGKLPKTGKEAIEIIDKNDLDELKKAVDAW